jgi:AcrR family transcriptional regulator
MPEPTATRPEDLLADALETHGAAAAGAVRDGRHLRAERGRSAVVTATFELISGGANPTIADIASAAGISERTVFRYFPDRDALMAAVAAEVFPLIVHCFSLDRPEADLSTRLSALLALQVELHRIAGPFTRSVESTAGTSALATELLSLRRERLRAQIEVWLAPECTGPRADVVPLLEVLLSHHAIGRLLDQMPEPEVVAALRDGITTLLTA